MLISGNGKFIIYLHINGFILEINSGNLTGGAYRRIGVKEKSRYFNIASICEFKRLVSGGFRAARVKMRYYFRKIPEYFYIAFTLHGYKP